MLNKIYSKSTQINSINPQTGRPDFQLDIYQFKDFEDNITHLESR